jgi:hypothetical protein
MVFHRSRTAGEEDVKRMTDYVTPATQAAGGEVE